MVFVVVKVIWMQNRLKYTSIIFMSSFQFCPENASFIDIDDEFVDRMIDVYVNNLTNVDFVFRRMDRCPLPKLLWQTIDR